MATKTYNFGLGGNYLWDNPSNWSPYGTLPQAGDTAVIPAGGFVDTGPGLLLYDITVQLSTDTETGDVTEPTPLTLNDSRITDTGPGHAATVAYVSVGTLSLDKMSFIAATASGVTIEVAATKIYNSGIIGAEKPGAGLALEYAFPIPQQAAALVDNTGQIVASNQGNVLLANTSVTGNGQITVSSGGYLALRKDSSIASTQHINLGGQDGTTLAIDGSSSVAAPISGFLPTDTIDLLDFPASGAFVVSTSTTNPTLLIFNLSNPFEPKIDAIALTGNYTNYHFAATPDGSGGTDISVHR